MLWAGVALLYVVCGVVWTNFLWNDEVDEFYGGLTPNWRYVFFFVMIVFWFVWVPIFYLRHRKKHLEEE